MYVMLINILHL